MMNDTDDEGICGRSNSIHQYISIYVCLEVLYYQIATSFQSRDESKTTRKTKNARKVGKLENFCRHKHRGRAGLAFGIYIYIYMLDRWKVMNWLCHWMAGYTALCTSVQITYLYPQWGIPVGTSTRDARKKRRNTESVSVVCVRMDQMNGLII